MDLPTLVDPEKPLKRLVDFMQCVTGLKPGEN